jgi:hypothetical protein
MNRTSRNLQNEVIKYVSESHYTSYTQIHMHRQGTSIIAILILDYFIQVDCLTVTIVQ